VSDSDESAVDDGPTDGDEVSAASTGESDSSEEGPPAPTRQSAAFRRQQFYVGIGGVVLAGVAVAVILIQRFPDAPALLPVLGGTVAAGVVFWLVRKSLFPTEQTVSDDDAD